MKAKDAGPMNFAQQPLHLAEHKSQVLQYDGPNIDDLFGVGHMRRNACA